MRAYEQEILKSMLKDEKDVIKQLQELYKDTLSQIDNEIARLQGRYDTEQLSSVIYQLDYQKALKKEIEGYLNTLQSKQYTTITDYLTECYNSGFMGTMYSLNQQGIPLIMPIDQEQVINAIVHQSKISKSLYEALGLDVSNFRKQISSEISRGIANKLSYQEIANNIQRMSGIPLNNAIRIARTEGHRITSQSQLDASIKAKEQGADIVNQWNATLDSRTRKTHQMLDGQIREVGDYFEINGHKALAPSQFGIAREDINCRCALSQRAKWALDDEELKVLEERAKFYGLDKTKDLDDFKNKYLKAVEEETNK